MIYPSVIGKDPEGRYWFKSDQYLTDITEAANFFVRKKGWWKQRWELWANFTMRAAYFRDPIKQRVFVPAITQERMLGYYSKEIHASMALEEVMRVREIKEIPHGSK